VQALWLSPFVEAWVRVRGGTTNALADGDPPHTPRRRPFQAWSLGKVLRVDRVFRARISNS